MRLFVRRAYSWLSSFHFTLVWNRVLQEMATSLLVQFSFLSRLHPLLYSPGGTTIRRQRAFLPFSNVIVRTMLLRPIQTKFKKSQKNLRAVTPVPGRPLIKPSPCFGAYGIFAKEPIRLKASQIEAARYAILKTVGKKGLRIWVRTFPHIPVTKKPLEVRMGKGKGAVDHFVSYVKMGAMLYEYNCPDLNTAKLACKAAAYKLPIKVGFVQREREK